MVQFKRLIFSTLPCEGWRVFGGLGEAFAIESLFAPGLCVGPTLDLASCDETVATWSFSSELLQMLSPTPRPAWAGCLGSVQTACNDLGPWMMGCLNCSTSPGSIMPWCNASVGIDDRVHNVMTFLETADVTKSGAQVSRLGLPKDPTGECLHGFVADCGKNTTGHTNCPTVFPAGLTTAASFNDTLFHAIGTVISVEGRAFSNQGDRPHQICWSPDLNPMRHPAWYVEPGSRRPLHACSLGAQGMSPGPFPILPACISVST